MARSMPKRPTLSLCLVAAAALTAGRGLLATIFATPAALQVSHATDVGSGWLTQPLPTAKGPDASSLPRGSLASGLVHSVVPFTIYAGMAAGLRNLLRAPKVAAKEGGWDARRTWTALNVANHGIYALLFIIRSFFYTGVGGNDRPFFFESFFLGWLCGPSFMLPTWLGWDNNMYNQPAVLEWVTKFNSPTSGVFPEWIAACVGSPAFMYLYQIAEGTFHLMIVAGGLRAFFNSTWPPKKDSSMRLFRWGLWLELIVMDIAYVTAYSFLPTVSVPGHWGLTTIMMLIHHVNVVPDLMCAWHERKASKQAAKEASRSPAPAMA